MKIKAQKSASTLYSIREHIQNCLISRLLANIVQILQHSELGLTSLCWASSVGSQHYAARYTDRLIATHVVILTSCISSSVIVHLDQSYYQNALSRYGIVSLEIVLVLILGPSLHKFKSSLKSIDLVSLVHWSLFCVCMFVCFNGLP